jgi:hypothetical protein
MGTHLACGAETPAPPKLSGDADELALFSDLPVVVSASRQQTVITRSPVPVSVLSFGGAGVSALHVRLVPIRPVPRNGIRNVAVQRVGSAWRLVRAFIKVAPKPRAYGIDHSGSQRADEGR